MSHTETAVAIGAFLLCAWVAMEVAIKIELWRAEQRRKRILGRFHDAA